MIWDRIKLAGAVVGAVTIIITSSFGAYSFFARKVIEKEHEKQTSIILEQKVDRWIIIDSLHTLQLGQVIDSLSFITKNQKTMSKQISKLNNWVPNHLKQSKDIEELLNWIVP